MHIETCQTDRKSELEHEKVAKVHTGNSLTTDTKMEVLTCRPSIKIS